MPRTYRKMTPYEKIMNAAYHGRGLTLSADEVFDLSLDASISEAAAIQAEHREDSSSPLREVFRSAEREAQLDESLMLDGRRWCDSPAREVDDNDAHQGGEGE